MTSVTVTVRAPAKVNLYLGVGRRRPDGYHELATVYQAISLYDEVTARRGTEIRVHVTGRDAHLVPTGTRNLAYQAVAALAERTGLSAGIHLHVAKKIPVAAGLAGGSADAAAALVAADALWETGLSRAALTELAADLGSDVPFCVLGGTAVGIGRGEQLSPALVRGQFHWVLALAEGGLSTPAVYAEHDRVTRAAAPPPDVPTRLLAGLRAGDTAAVAHALHNDLQAAACSLMPDLARVLDAGRAAGALGGLVSGSGPTVAFLVADAQAGQELGAALLASGVCRRVEQAVGPVPGARVVAR